MKILHLQIPLEPNKSYKNALAISPETLGKFVKLVQDKIGDDWQVIATPFIPSVFGDTVSFYNFDMNIVDKDEFLELIKKK